MRALPKITSGQRVRSSISAAIHHPQSGERTQGSLFPEEEVVNMALYTILRIYEVPAENRIQATDRMMEALAFHVENNC